MMTDRDQVVGMPRDFLAAWLLLILRQWSMHGYELMQQLTTFGFAALDPATVYRTLRQLEKDGLIQSKWDLGDSGPARRTYRLTDAGEAFLASWAQGLEQFREMLDSFFRFYGLVLPVQPPAQPTPSASYVPPAGAPRHEPPRARAHVPSSVPGDAVALAESVAAAYDAVVTVASSLPTAVDEATGAASPAAPGSDATVGPNGVAVAAEQAEPAAEMAGTGDARPEGGALADPPSKRPAAKRAANRSNSRKLPGKGKKE